MSANLEGRFLGTQLYGRKFSNFAVVHSRYSSRQEFPNHSHANAFLAVVVRGAYIERCGSKTLECKAGSVLFHTAGESHSNRFFEGGGQVLNVEILPHFIDTLQQQGVDTTTPGSIQSPHALQLTRLMQRDLARPDATAQIAVEGLTLQLLAHLFRCREAPQRSQPCAWLRRVRDLLHSRYREPLTLIDLAADVRVHPVHLARNFSKHFGCTVGEYIRKLRVTAACHDLATSTLSISEIASRHGFADQSHLTRLLKRHTGSSPRQYRQSAPQPLQ